MQKNRDAAWATRRDRAHQMREGFPQSTAMRDYRPEVAGMPTDAIPDRIAGLVADREARSTTRRSSLMREMTNAMNKHGQDFHVVPPFTAEEATPAAVEQWAMAEKQRLDGHELVQYEEQCRNAATEMTSALEYDYDPSADAIGLQAAQALGRDPSTVFKTLVIALDSGELICAIVPSDRQLDLKAIAAGAGAKKAELADPRKAERATGYVVGGISPLGQRKRLRTFVDAAGSALDEIVVNGGRRGLQLMLRSADLVRITSAAVLPVTR